MIWAWLSMAWATCPPLTTAQLSDELSQLEDHYADLNEEAFLGGTDALLVRLPCMEAPLPPATVAQLDRLLALRLWGQEPDRALAAVRGARATAPALELPTTLVAPTHPLAKAWSAAPSAEPTRRLPRPREGALWFDGVRGAPQPTERLTVIQLTDAQGALTTTALWFPGDDLPAYEAVPRARRRLQAAAGLSALGAGALYGYAWAGHQRYTDPSAGLTRDQLDALKGRTNGAVIGTSLLLTTGLSTAIASLVVHP